MIYPDCCPPYLDCNRHIRSNLKNRAVQYEKEQPYQASSQLSMVGRVRVVNSIVLLESELYYWAESMKDGILLDLKFIKKETKGSGICSLSFLDNYRRIAIFEETTNSRVGRQKQLKEGA